MFEAQNFRERCYNSVHIFLKTVAMCQKYFQACYYAWINRKVDGRSNIINQNL